MHSYPPHYRISADALEGALLNGRYRVLEKITHGGMAWVYRGEDEFRRPVALKVLFSHLAQDSNACRRLRLEAQLQNDWNHPNLVHVFESIETDGIVGMVMEWIEGPSLQHMVEHKVRPFDYSILVLMFQQIVNAVGYAHEHGVVHRDLKPSNILLQRFPGGFVPKVADFGIAKSLHFEGTALTASNNAIGTVQYMAPEQILSAKHIDHRADIYSLGAILYQFVTGRMLFSARGMHQWAYCQRMVAPDPPRIYAPDIPKAFEFVILRCLEKDPKDRYADCQALNDALRATGLALETGDTLLNVEEATRPTLPPTLISQGPGVPPWGTLGSAPTPETVGLLARPTSSWIPTPPTEDLSRSPGTNPDVSEKTVEAEAIMPDTAALLSSPSLLLPPPPPLVEPFNEQSPRSSLKIPPPKMPPPVPVLSPPPPLASDSEDSWSRSPEPPTPHSHWAVGLYVFLFSCILGGGGFWVFRTLFQKPPAVRGGVLGDGVCKEGDTRICFSGLPHQKGVGICRAGRQTCFNGRFGRCIGEVLPAVQELCNGQDDDCNGQIDDLFPEKGKPCTIKEDACLLPGIKSCNADQTGLYCKPLENLPNPKRYVRLNVAPKVEPFSLYVRGLSRKKLKKYRVQDNYCVELREDSQMKISAPGYESCSFGVEWKHQRLQIRMQEKSELYNNAPHYCLKPPLPRP